MSVKRLFHREAAHSPEEKELWPDAIWRLAALLRAGCTPAFACRAVADYLTDQRELAQGLARSVPWYGRWGPAFRQNQTLGLALEQMQHLFEQCADDAERGLLLAQTCRRLSTQPLREPVATGLVALEACWHIAQSSGASVAGVFENLAAYLETEIDVGAQRETALSGPRATGRILSWLPLLGLGLGILMGTDPLGVLFGSVGGVALALVGVALAWGGHRWTARLIARAERGEL